MNAIHINVKWLNSNSASRQPI